MNNFICPLCGSETFQPIMTFVNCKTEFGERECKSCTYNSRVNPKGLSYEEVYRRVGKPCPKHLIGE